MELFVVGFNLSYTGNGTVWSFEGVFDSEEKALVFCTTSQHWVGSIMLNEFVGGINEDREWPNAYFPIEE